MKKKIIEFGNVLADLPFQAKGVLLTPPGRSGLYNQFAENKNVILYEAMESESTESDSGESIKKICFHLHIYQPHFGRPIFNVDKEWEMEELKRLGISEKEHLTIGFKVSDSLAFYDENGEKVTTALYLFNQLVPKGFNELSQTDVIHRFDTPTFIKTNNKTIPPAKD